ncbi:hypothetical protein LCGC14_3012820, partial [marine sediment metagenome]
MSDGCSSLAFMTKAGLDPKFTKEAQLAIIKVVFGTSWRQAIRACHEHDKAYAFGGNRGDRLIADGVLLACWLEIGNQHRAPNWRPWTLWQYRVERRGIRAWAAIGYEAIRVFGGPQGRIPGVSWGYLPDQDGRRQF